MCVCGGQDAAKEEKHIQEQEEKKRALIRKQREEELKRRRDEELRKKVRRIKNMPMGPVNRSRRGTLYSRWVRSTGYAHRCLTRVLF